MFKCRLKVMSDKFMKKDKSREEVFEVVKSLTSDNVKSSEALEIYAKWADQFEKVNLY